MVEKHGRAKDPAPERAHRDIWPGAVLLLVTVVVYGQLGEVWSPQISLSHLPILGEAPDFTLPDRKDTPRSFNVWRSGGRVGVIFHHAACDVCGRPPAGVRRTQEHLYGVGVPTAIVIATPDETAPQVPASLENYLEPVFFDNGAGVSRRYRARHVTLVIIDSQGNRRYQGPLPDPAEIDALIGLDTRSPRSPTAPASASVRSPAVSPRSPG